jgi:hypothetical protein
MTAIDKAGAVYVATSNYFEGVDYASHLYGFNTYGDLMFEYATPLDNPSDVRRLAIADNGTIYSLLNGAIKAFGPVVDLSVALDCSPNPVAINGVLTCTVIVANGGPDAATAPSLKLFLPANLANPTIDNPGCTPSGNTITCSDLGTLPADGTTILTLTGTAPGTLTTLSVTAQVTSDLADTNPGNNFVTASIPVRYPGVELSVTSVSNPPATILKGSAISITDTVKNNGRVAAGTTYVQYYLSTNGTTKYKKLTTTANGSTPASRPISSLASGDSSTGSPAAAYVPTSTQSGVYYLLACADETHLVTEYIENNNCTASQTTTTVN